MQLPCDSPLDTSFVFVELCGATKFDILYEMAPQFDRDQVFCMKLVEAVQKHRCLYDYTLSDYTNKESLEKAWSEVANAVHRTVYVCKERWRNIKTVFQRDLKPGSSKKPYYLNEMLQFLIPFMKSNCSQTNVSSEDPIAINNNKQEICYVDDLPKIARSRPLRSMPVKSQSRKKFCKTTKKQSLVSHVDEAFIELCKHRQKNSREKLADNPRKMFLLSLHPDVQKMSSHQFRMFQMEVLTLIDHILPAKPEGMDESSGENESQPEK